MMGVIHSAEPFRPAKAVRTSPGHAPFLPPLPSAGLHYSTHGTYSSTIKASPNNPIMARLASFIQISLNSYLISCFKNAQQPLSKTKSTEMMRPPDALPTNGRKNKSHSCCGQSLEHYKSLSGTAPPSHGATRGLQARQRLH